jgi:hypothetical protein
VTFGMIPCKHISPGVKLFDIVNARSESFSSEDMASATASIPPRRRKPKPESAESLL